MWYIASEIKDSKKSRKKSNKELRKMNELTKKGKLQGIAYRIEGEKTKERSERDKKGDNKCEKTIYCGRKITKEDRNEERKRKKK